MHEASDSNLALALNPRFPPSQHSQLQQQRHAGAGAGIGAGRHSLSPTHDDLLGAGGSEGMQCILGLLRVVRVLTLCAHTDLLHVSIILMIIFLFDFLSSSLTQARIHTRATTAAALGRCSTMRLNQCSRLRLRLPPRPIEARHCRRRPRHSPR